MRELEEKDLLSSEDYQARRAFQVEECEDEGPHYMIELEDGAVLYLNGQYLDECEPVEGDPEFNQPRRFPCASFTLRRHKIEGYVVDIVCHGQVLEPEGIAPPFSEDVFKRGFVPVDGQIIEDLTYDLIKSRLFIHP